MAQDPSQYPSAAPGKSGRIGTGSLVGGGILTAGLLAFIFQNTAKVEFHWLFWSFQAPLWLMLLIVSIVCFIIGQFALMWRRHRRRKARRERRR